jgi:hypothetical protein
MTIALVLTIIRADPAPGDSHAAGERISPPCPAKPTLLRHIKCQRCGVFGNVHLNGQGTRTFMKSGNPNPADERPAVQEAPALPLFPQRFTPFEYYFLIEQVARYPQVFYIRLDCRGPLDREALSQAYQLALGRHPLLSARIEYDHRGWPMWLPSVAPPICWNDLQPTAESSSNASTLTSRLLARAIVDGDETQLSFMFDHVATDGMGGFQFISDLMVAYAHILSDDAGPPKWRVLDSELLRQRGRHTLFGRTIRLVDLLRLPRVTLPLLFRRVAVVSDRGKYGNAGVEQTPPPDFLIHTLSEQESTALSLVARKLSVRLNELLLRDYFLMLTAWNENTPEARLPMRVLVPINLRRRHDLRMPAANMFGFAFVTRRASRCQNRTDLLQSVRSDMAAIKSERRALYHELGQRLFCIWPRLFRWSVGRKWTFATAVFTNLNAGFDHVPLPWRGDRRAAGDLIIENGYGAGPLRPDTRLSLAIHDYAGRTSIAIRSDEHVFSPEQQNELLQAYLDQLRTTIELQS